MNSCNDNNRGTIADICPDKLLELFAWNYDSLHKPVLMVDTKQIYFSFFMFFQLWGQYNNLKKRNDLQVRRRRSADLKNLSRFTAQGKKFCSNVLDYYHCQQVIHKPGNHGRLRSSSYLLKVE